MASSKNNRALTLDGANKIFGVLGILIEHDAVLGVYSCSHGRTVLKASTLTALCQALVLTLAQSPIPEGLSVVQQQ